MYALDAKTGAIKWKYETDKTAGRSAAPWVRDSGGSTGVAALGGPDRWPSTRSRRLPYP